MAAARTDIDMSETVFDIVAPALTELVTAEDEDRMDVDHGENERSEKEV